MMTIDNSTITCGEAALQPAPRYHLYICVALGTAQPLATHCLKIGKVLERDSKLYTGDGAKAPRLPIIGW